MRADQNIKELSELPIGYMGFIFYDKSKRYAIPELNAKVSKAVPPNINTVGVFVNETSKRIVKLASVYGFGTVQLHGSESPKQCKELKEHGFTVIKVFPVKASINVALTETFANVVDYFLFDTQAQAFGGTGKKFNWDLLAKQRFAKPFFLSGGISLADLQQIKKFKHPDLHALDINSKFETAPGSKNIAEISKFIRSLQR